MGVTAVVVTYRSEPTVEACLRSLVEAAGGLSLTTVVVDNGSDDDTLARVRGAGVDVDVVDNGANLGFAAANNRGLARATGEWVLFANPDTVWPAGSLARLVDAAEQRADAGIVSPALVGADGAVQPTVEEDLDLRRVLAGLVRIGGAVRPARPMDGPPVPVDWVHGAAMLMPLELTRRVGGWDERFFLFFEDLDLCWRVRQAGRTVLVVPDVRVSHVGGASMARSGGAAWVAAQRVTGLATFLAKRQGRTAARLYGAVALAAYGLTPTATHRAMARAGARAVSRPAGPAGG